MEIVALDRKIIDELAGLFLELWPDASYEVELENCRRILHSNNEICLLSKDQNDYNGFIYMSIRNDYVEGTSTSPVAYIEGLYVKKGYRRTGIAGQLISAGEEWGKQMGCSEIASDAEIENEISIAVHKKAGFKEVNRIVCFVKEIK